MHCSLSTFTIARLTLAIAGTQRAACTSAASRVRQHLASPSCLNLLGAALVSWIAAAQNGSRSEALALSQKLLELKALRLSVAGGEEDEPTTPMELRDSAECGYC